MPDIDFSNMDSDFLSKGFRTANDISTSLLYDPTRTFSEDERSQLDELYPYAVNSSRPDLEKEQGFLFRAIERARMHNQFNDVRNRMNAILAKPDLTQQDIDNLWNLSAEAGEGYSLPVEKMILYDAAMKNIYGLVDQGVSRFNAAKAEQERREQEAAEQAAAEAEAKKPLNILKGYVNQGIDYVKAHPWQVGIPAAALSALGLGALYYGSTSKKKKKKKD